MWYERDPTLRRTGGGNTIIKNLDLTIGSKDLFQTFSAFGKILSAKVATLEDGSSKGYGFIHFERTECAKTIIDKMNGETIKGKEIIVEHFFDMVRILVSIYICHFHTIAEM